MNRQNILLLGASILTFLSINLSCSGDSDCKDCQNNSDQDSTSMADTMAPASLDQALSQDKTQPETKEMKENHEKIVKKYGEQWDFCTCVLANDSINKAFAKNLSDKDAEKLMARWEHVEMKCKEFLTQPNTTPEERAAHEKKVKRCLRSAR